MPREDEQFSGNILSGKIVTRVGPRVARVYGTVIYRQEKLHLVEDTIRLRTRMGYELEATHKHRVWICRERELAGWAYMDGLRIGDYVPVLRGRQVFGYLRGIELRPTGANIRSSGRTGAKPTPQLPITAVVTPCQLDGTSSLSHVACPS